MPPPLSFTLDPLLVFRMDRLISLVPVHNAVNHAKECTENAQQIRAPHLRIINAQHKNPPVVTVGKLDKV